MIFIEHKNIKIQQNDDGVIVCYAGVGFGGMLIWKEFLRFTDFNTAMGLLRALTNFAEVVIEKSVKETIPKPFLDAFNEIK